MKVNFQTLRCRKAPQGATPFGMAHKMMKETKIMGNNAIKSDASLISIAEASDLHMQIIAGEKVIEDFTSPRHNLVVAHIAGAIRDYISAHKGTCKVFTDSVALYANELCNDNDDYFLPDIMVVCDLQKIDEKGVHSVPKFVAEVTSESTKKFDYNRKLEIYKKIGVEEYWIVDLERNAIVKYLMIEDYILQFLTFDQAITVNSFPGLEIDLQEYGNMGAFDNQDKSD